MSWLARLDDRAHLWPSPGRWLYLGVKWTLIALGAFLLFMTMLDRAGLKPMFH